MSVLVVGLSHRSAPVATLERASVSGDALTKLLLDVSQAGHVAGTFVVSTCNRVEVYAEVGKFHGGVSAVSELLARHSGIAHGDLTPHLYVHYEDRAVQHLLAVACGLDSMVVGESQIVGQVRQAIAAARRRGTLSRLLGEVGDLALRTAKRVQSQTGIARTGGNLVSVGVMVAASSLAPAGARQPAAVAGDPGAGTGQPGAGQPGTGDSGQPLAGQRVLVVGAGSMSSLAVATAARKGARHITVANRTPDRARRLAASVSGSVADFRDLAPALAAADLVVSCTGSPGLVVTAGLVTRALSQRGGKPRPLVLLDLALPRDVDPAAGGLPGVTVVDLETLGRASSTLDGQQAEDVAAAASIVAEEFAAWAAAAPAARVAPTVVALRAKAADVVESELTRLSGKLSGLDDRTHREIAVAMRRVVDKLLHAPTVRVKELAGSPGGDSYEAALRVLFDLDPAAVEAVTRADVGLVPPVGLEADK